MRFVVDLTPDMVDAINRCIQEGRYRSVQDFLFAAVQNQLYDVEQIGAVVTVQPGVVGSTSPHRIDSTIQPVMADLRYQLLVPDLGKVETVAPPEPEQVDSVIYGLWNRFFPTKITARVLANMLKGDGSAVPLDTLQENAASVARELGKILLRKERNLGRTRSERIATGLPTKRDEFKAKARFRSHFVGLLSKNRIEGAPAVLRLINIQRGENGRVVVGLTAAGLKFASLSNPVIDREDFNSSLSDEERRFLLEHISSELPQEKKLMLFILEAIKKGANDPGALQRELEKQTPELKGAELVTLRSGLLSRMSELKLLTRERNGLTMRYQVTHEGEKYLKEGSQ